MFRNNFYEVLNAIQIFIASYSLFLTVLGTCFGLSIQYGFAYYQKAKLEKTADFFNHQLQIKFLNTELQVRQLYNIYPALFGKFKDAEKEFGYLFGSLVRNKLNLGDDWKEWAEKCSMLKELAGSFLRGNLLFLSPQVKALAIQIDKQFDDAWIRCLKSKVESQDLDYKKEMLILKNSLDKLESQMVYELQANSNINL